MTEPSVGHPEVRGRASPKVRVFLGRADAGRRGRAGELVLMQSSVYSCIVSKVLTSLPVGERVGIAFSGGLDTSVAVAWMREKGAVPCTYTADLGQYDEPEIDTVPDRAGQYGAELARLVDCSSALVEEGLSALACGAFHIRSGGKTYFNTTPLGRAVTGTLLVRAMHADEVEIWGDGSTFKGNDIERFYRYGLLANPDLRIYKPWLDADFVSRARWPARDERLAHRARPALPVEPGEGLLHRRQHLGRHARGEDPRAPRRVDGGRRADHGRAGSGTRRSPSRPRTSRSPSSRAARSPSTGVDLDPVALVDEANTIGGRHGLGMSDQIENRIIEAKSRGIYEAPGMALLHIAYERLLNAVHNEDTLANYHAEGRRLGRLLYEGRWLDPQTPDAARVAPALGRLGRSPARSPCGCAAATTTRSSTPAGRTSATTPTSCRWSAWRTPRSARSTGSAS